MRNAIRFATYVWPYGLGALFFLGMFSLMYIVAKIPDGMCDGDGNPQCVPSNHSR
jgi:hypothetical protein